MVTFAEKSVDVALCLITSERPEYFEECLRHLEIAVSRCKSFSRKNIYLLQDGPRPLEAKRPLPDARARVQKCVDLFSAQYDPSNILFVAEKAHNCPWSHITAREKFLIEMGKELLVVVEDDILLHPDALRTLLTMTETCTEAWTVHANYQQPQKEEPVSGEVTWKYFDGFLAGVYAMKKGCWEQIRDLMLEYFEIIKDKDYHHGDWPDKQIMSFFNKYGSPTWFGTGGDATTHFCMAKKKLKRAITLNVLAKNIGKVGAHQNEANFMAMKDLATAKLSVDGFVGVSEKAGSKPLPILRSKTGSMRVVTPVLNQSEYTKVFLEAMATVNHGLPIDLVLVNNGSTEKTSSLLRNFSEEKHLYLKSVQLITMESNVGFAAALNAGLRSRYDGLSCVMHNDTVPFEGWAKEIAAGFVDEDVAVVIPRTSYANEDAPCISSVREKFLKLKPPNKSSVTENDIKALVQELYHGKQPSPDSPLRFSYTAEPSSFCMAFRTELLSKYGYFDEDFFPKMFEDKLWFVPIARDGLICVVSNMAFVHHFGNITSDGRGFCFPEMASVNEQKFKDKLVGLNKQYYKIP
jgi:GT2 family glycosyltransferase